MAEIRARGHIHPLPARTWSARPGQPGSGRATARARGGRGAWLAQHPGGPGPGTVWHSQVRGGGRQLPPDRGRQPKRRLRPVRAWPRPGQDGGSRSSGRAPRAGSGDAPRFAALHRGAAQRASDTARPGPCWRRRIWLMS